MWDEGDSKASAWDDVGHSSEGLTVVLLIAGRDEVHRNAEGQGVRGGEAVQGIRREGRG